MQVLLGLPNPSTKRLLVFFPTMDLLDALEVSDEMRDDASQSAPMLTSCITDQNNNLTLMLRFTYEKGKRKYTGILV